MIKVNKLINLKQLDNELNNLGLNASLNDKNEITHVGLTEFNIATQTQLKLAIDAHQAINDETINAEAKATLLAKLGITADEAKLLLA
jgi:hypothetical protein